jgi:hypothetical protein
MADEPIRESSSSALLWITSADSTKAVPTGSFYFSS